MEPDRFARARILLEQDRYDLAAREVTARLADDPNDPEGYILLALCQSNLNDPKAAETARTAVELAPNDDRAHFVSSLTQRKRGNLDEAERAIRRAIELNSWNAGYFGQHAAIDVARYRWTEALKSADEGLAIDPDDETCLNLRAIALTKLGRHADAASTLEGALEKHPEDAHVHANRGWTLLHENEPRKAIEHFRESLRLDPNSEWAKEGLLEALRAKSWFYRRVLQFFLMLSRFPPRVQFGLIIGMLVLVRVLDSLGKQFPAAEPFFNILIFAYAAFVSATWFAKHIMNVLLLFNPDGRMILDRRQKWVSGLCTALVVGVLVAAAIAVFTRSDLSIAVALFLFLGSIHFASVVEIPAGRFRRYGIAASVAFLAAFGWERSERLTMQGEFAQLLARAIRHDERLAELKKAEMDLKGRKLEEFEKEFEKQVEDIAQGRQPEGPRKEPDPEVELHKRQVRELAAEGAVIDFKLRSLKSNAEKLSSLESVIGFASIGGLLLHSYLGVRARRSRDPD